MIHDLRTPPSPRLSRAGRPEGPIASRETVVIYSRAGHLALTLDTRGSSPDLEALQARLRAKGFTVVTHIPLSQLRDWGAVDTPAPALDLARTILERRAGGLE